MNKFNVDEKEGYDYQWKLNAIEKNINNPRIGIKDTIYNLLLFDEFPHVVRWYLAHIGIKTQMDCLRFFIDNLRDFQMREHHDKIKSILDSLAPGES